MTKISVVVPIFGVEKYLKQAIESVLSQTLNDFELILVDDGCKDNCPQIIDEYAQKDTRIIPVHKENGGLGSSMNAGLDRANGEYIAILEPDDYIDSKMYEDLYNIAKKFDSDIVKSGYYDNLQTKDEKRTFQVKWDENIPQDRSFNIKECGLFLQYHPSVWTCIYKREFLNKHNIRYPEAKGSAWVDNPFQVKSMCLAEKINYTPKAYYYWLRTNRNESDDLKDYTVPFDRSDEIHNWLEENNITDEEILRNLYIREIAYIRIVLGMKKISNISDCYFRINKMLERIDEHIIMNSLKVNPKIKKAFLKIKNNPKKYRNSLLFKRLKQDFLSIRWNKKEKRIIFCGKVIIKK